MPQFAWRQLWSQWSPIFTVIVVGVFIFSAFDLPDWRSASSASSPSSQPITASPSSTHSELEVHSFRLKTSGDQPTVEATLEVHNRSEGQSSFRPGELVLISASGARLGAETSVDDVAVAGGRSVLVPASFPLTSTAGLYRLEYRGDLIFSGTPVAS